MPHRDLTYVFNPVIHEPLSKIDCSCLGLVTDKVSCSSSACGTVRDGAHVETSSGTNLQEDVCSTNDGHSLHSNQQHFQAELEQEAFRDMSSAFEHKTTHPRKAMSLFLKAGKALVVAGQEDAAVECFESLIHLAKEQLCKIHNDKKQLPAVQRDQDTSTTSAKENKLPLMKQKSLPAVLNQVKRTQSLCRETRDKSLRKENSRLHQRSQSFRREKERSRTLDEMQNLQSALVQDIICKNEDKKVENTQTPAAQNMPQESVQCETETSKVSCTLQTVENTVECIADVNECCVDVVECVSEVIEEDRYCSIKHEQIGEFTTEECIVECVGEANSRGAPYKENEELVTVCAVEEEVCNDTPCMMVTVNVSCTEEVEREGDVCMVECTETVSALEFEVVTMEECDDTQSTGSGDHVRTEEIVMHAEEKIVEQVPQSPHEKALLKRSYVVSELIDTEQSYIQDLGHVLKGYRPALKEDSVPPELKNMEKEIFGNLEEIYQWHTSQFFSWLRECDDNPEKLGDLFVGAEGRLEDIYSEYCRNKPKSDAIVEKYMDTYFKECKKKLGHRLQLSDYLIKPVQRVTKYQLMLRDILKHTEGAGEDGSDIQRALDVALRILKRTNDMMYVAMLQGFEVTSDVTGTLILQNSFVVAEGKSKAKGKERRVFLFEKHLIISEPIEREAGLPAFKYIHSLKTKGLGQTESVDSNPCKWAVWMRRLGHSEIFVFTAPTFQEKEKWIKAIKDCNEVKKKRGGFFKSLYRSRFGEADDTKEDGKCRRISVKRKLNSTHKKKSKHPTEPGRSERLKENIRKYRAEARWLASNSDTVENENDTQPVPPPPEEHSIADEPAMPLSPDSVLPEPWKEAVVQLSPEEQRQRLETEEKQLNRVLFVTRMITARLLQGKDPDHALSLYTDVVATMLPPEELKKLETWLTQREQLLQQCTETYDKWRKRHESESIEILEESYFSLSSLLNETAGFSSLNVGSPRSVVIYTITAAGACREERWGDACQALYRVSVVYSALQLTLCAIDSLLDAHWMCCQAEDLSRALQFLYNAFIRTLAARDVMRCLRIEQQSMFLVEKMQVHRQSERNNEMDNADEASELLDTSNQATPQHLSFLVNMSRATRSRDWAWFELSEPELQRLVGERNGNKANAILSALYNKMKQSIGSRTVPPLGE